MYFSAKSTTTSKDHGKSSTYGPVLCVIPGFEVVLQDKNGVIELAVNRDKRLLGIGWHPERPVNQHTRESLLTLIKTL